MPNARVGRAVIAAEAAVAVWPESANAARTTRAVTAAALAATLANVDPNIIVWKNGKTRTDAFECGAWVNHTVT